MDFWVAKWFRKFSVKIYNLKPIELVSGFGTWLKCNYLYGKNIEMS